MNITSRQLRAFVLTARHESFSRAAEQMFITQSGLSMIVRELESQLGVRLFERTTRKVKLSEFGTQFLPTATRCLSELEEAAVDIRRSSPWRRSSHVATQLLASAIIAFDMVADYLAIAM